MAQVQLLCMRSTLVIARLAKSLDASTPAFYAHAVPPLLDILFYRWDASDESRVLSYIENEEEVSMVLDEELLELFPDGTGLETEGTGWRALQVVSAGTGAFDTQLQLLAEITTILAQHNISVFQISTYQTDYVLVKTEALDDAISCLQSLCDITMEDTGEEYACTNSLEEETQDDCPTSFVSHNHTLSLPSSSLSVVQMTKSCVKRHMYDLVCLLFQHSPYLMPLSKEISGEDKTGVSGHAFLNYSDMGSDVCIVTSDKEFLDGMKQLVENGEGGVIVSPDAWKVVHIGQQPMGFGEVGVVAAQTSVLKTAATMVFYLSTYSTDFMLVKEEEWEDALPVFKEHFVVYE